MTGFHRIVGLAIDMKTCSKCKVEKPLSGFNKHSSNKDGHQYQCKECRKETNRKSFQKRYAANNEKFLDYYKNQYWENREKRLEVQKNYRSSVKGKAKKCALQRKREINKINRTPKWADFTKIQMYYDVCAFFNEVNGYTKYHVDHVVPLQGKNVSGLHVHNNLQVIPAKENLNKGNKHYG